MKLFSNFDTGQKMEAHQEAIQKFSADNVVLIRKSGLFLAVKVILPFIWWTLLFVLLQFPIYLSLDEFWNIRYLLTGLMALFYLVLLYPVVKHYIDYIMDFSIITPQYVTRYNQSWFIKRDIRSFNTRNIKTITVEKNSLLYNIFDNGNLTFLSEWDRDDDGQIMLHYVKDPEEKRKEITRIMKLWIGV